MATAKSIATKYRDISSKTITNDLKYMTDVLDIPIEYDPKRHGWILTQEDFALDHIRLSESDLFAVCIAEKALEQYKDSPVYDRLVKVFEKIRSSLPPRTVTDLSELNSDISMSTFPISNGDVDTWNIVFDAFRNNSTLKIAYQKPADQEITWREIDPYHVTNHSGSWYVVAFCHLRKDVRIFNFLRIKDAKLTHMEFTIPKDFDAELLLKESFDMYAGSDSQTVKIKFDSTAAPYIKEKSWHATQELEECEDGSLIFTAQLNNLTGIVPWIFSWGKYATILEPGELIDEFRQDLDELVNNYN